MTSSGPIIEELPDDYEVEERHQASSSSSSHGAIRRGFLTKSQPRVAKESHDTAPGSTVPFSSTEGNLPAPPAHPIRTEANDASPEEVLEGLRRRLRRAAEEASARATDAASEDTKGLKEALESMQAKWPSLPMKTAAAKANKETLDALAELRTMTNDSRRLRSGEERRAASELRRAAEEVSDRVQKVAAEAKAASSSSKDRSANAVAAFHSLPLPVKIQILAQDKAALLLLGGSFMVGMAVVLVIVLEVYSAWGCGIRCER
eukprot:TRINITY_DN95207_c0_g1_i1.p1 TRINITY_DN95207_c0_g1~~TRINITY_DN95207_c0_g1_i1.p1  ORF type:complete len:262 (-),score=61.56 TRINITY_DN95207_c0_g1_i1:30-815(-)